MKLTATILAVLTVAAFAQEAKAPAKSVPEVTRLRIVTAYQKALIKQNQLNVAKEAACSKDPDCQKLATEFSADANEFQAAYIQAKHDLQLSSSEELKLDPGAQKPSDQVTIVEVKVQPPPAAKP